ncbi:MAG: ABC transporter substrate-binding protein [Acidimicrobiaceae bacterium]|nr:ABC transporter substrate-binding protein [Acidimicrobiaceae bacterium]MYB85768.1 ABC transporter substrate-binding protein [Acidimicrobiaceae bacterium]MYH94193.1 ABC transporter substrate-binding protein [Acidimicrobiaceae bacterium]
MVVFRPGMRERSGSDPTRPSLGNCSATHVQRAILRLRSDNPWREHMRHKKHLLGWLAVLLAFGLVAAACGDDDDAVDEPAATPTDEAPTTDEPDEPDAAPDEMMEHLGDGSLGVVTVEPGDAIQIRSLEAITGDVAFFGLPIDRATQIAVDDYGQIHGFDVDTGTSLDDLCSNDGGQAAAQIIVADEDVVGVIGTSCSGAAVAAAPLITDAGMVLISGGNTSPALTSDLAGTAGPNYSVGYYRTAHNDLYQGAAMAKFVFGELGISEAAAIHDGDPYTQGLAQAFADAFEAEGGTITGFSAVNKDDTDMVPVLTEIAAGSPGALFFPIFQPAGDFVADQAPGVSGLEETVLLAADGLLNTNYLSLPQTRGMYFSGPDQRFGENVNESTGKTAVDFLATYEAAYGEAPAAPFWAHGYDATVLLLDAIKAASWVEDGNLMIDRQGIRDYLNSVQGFQGLIGTINCDNFGDCGAARITVVQNIGGEENAETSLNNVVFSYAPGTAGVASEGLPLAEAVAAGLSGVCPSPLVVQTDWFPESEHGAMYHLIGDDYVVDTENQTVTGSMVLDGAELGIDFQVRTGGPAIGFAPVSSYMYTDESIHLGYASTDAQILQWADAPLVSVVAPLEQNPQMIMWDPELAGVDSIADLGTENITVNVFGGGVFPLVFVAQGIWNADQVDPSYDGSPARFVSEGGAIAQQGFASSEVFTYEHIYEEWGRPVEFQLLHDAGFQIYSQTIGVRPRDMESMRPCLERLVPIIQQAVVSYDASPDRANAIIVDAVEQYASFWVYPPELADFSVQAQRDYGLIGNGPDSTVGNMELDRIQGVLDSILATDLAADVADGLSADDLFTNEFIDADIGF